MYIYCPGSRNAVKRGPHGSEGWDAAVRRICLSRGLGRTACPDGHVWGAVPPQCSGGFAAGTCAPHFARTQAPCRRCPDPILFSGEPETAQPPKIGGFVLPILPGKQYSALFTTLLKAPVKTITAGKPRPEYSAYPPVSTQIDAKNFRQDKSIHILPKHKTDAFRNMQKASAVKNYFNLRQS